MSSKNLDEKKQPPPGGIYPTFPAPGLPESSTCNQPGQYNPQAPPPYATQPPPGYAPNPSQQVPLQYAPRPTVMVKDGFDSGARFDVQGPSLPPPPPGCLPTASQVAASQGQNVVVTQKKDSYLSGGSGGGYTFW